MLLIGTIITIVQVYLSYGSFKDSSYFFLMFILTSIVTNICWGVVAKISPDNISLLRVGSIWDFLMGACWLILPVMLFNIELSNLQKTGLIFALIGSILINMENL